MAQRKFNLSDPNLVHCRYFAISPGKEPKIEFPQSTVDSVASKAAKSAKNRMVYILDGEVVRMSKIIAEECAVHIRSAILSGKFDDSVTPLSERWLARKKKLGQSSHVGVATLNTVASISAFRTNIRTKGESKHKGYAVGIKKSEYNTVMSGGSAVIRKKAIKPSAKLSFLEFGRKEYTHTNFFGKGVSVKIKAQPPRPVFKLAVLDYLKSIGISAGFGGSTLHLSKASSLELLKKSHSSYHRNKRK